VTYEEFVATRLQALVRCATVLTNDRALGEDLAQKVMLRAHRRWELIGELDNPYSYMRRILVNEFISWRRKWARIVPRSDAAELAGHRVAPDHAEGLADRATLAAEIVRLPRRQRAVIVLRYYEDLPDEQIASLLGCSASTVRVHAMRALHTLRVPSDRRSMPDRDCRGRLRATGHSAPAQRAGGGLSDPHAARPQVRILFPRRRSAARPRRGCVGH
jgi:RNA polymerase sigma-70 factor (sigma-E family)